MYDYEEIKQQVSAVIKYSQNIPEPKVDKLLAEWEQSKQKFIKRFGGLIYEFPEPLEFSLDPADCQKKIENFIYDCEFGWQNNKLAQFVQDNAEGFFDNTVVKSSNKAIPVGMKLVKAFKFFESNPQFLKDEQNLASQYIQENKIKGTLCLSIHPLDFLSSSENRYNWRSCHSLDGDYRAGNLSYMTDKTTFIAYIKGDADVALPNFPPDLMWNNKKWRMLLHTDTSDNILFAGRQYPFSSRPCADYVLDIYDQLTRIDHQTYAAWLSGKHFKGGWNTDYISSYSRKGEEAEHNLAFNHLFIGDLILGINKVMQVGEGSLNYNDILYSSIYKEPLYALSHLYSRTYCQPEDFTVGQSITCLRCGLDNKILDTGSMMCEECLQIYGADDDEHCYCTCCGRRMYIDDSYPVGDYDFLCDDCFNNETFTCAYCGNVFMRTDNHAWSENFNDWVCGDCANQIGE